jgi:hypothetical protein
MKPGNGRPNFVAAWWAALQRNVAYFVITFVEGDHAVGQTRFMAAVVFIVLFVILSRLFERPDLGWFESFAARAALSGPALQLAGIVVSFFTPQVLRHAVPPIVGFVLALVMGAIYMRDLLELSSLAPAYKYLTSTLFGTDYPQMTISEGKASVSDPAANPMLKIGGPGWVHIKLGSAALFERVVGPSAVRGAGTHFIRRFETLREAFDLREIERTKNDLAVMTRDGLPLVLNEMRVRFRMRSREQRTETNPFPVMTHAVRQAVYHPGRRVTDKGLENWADTVVGAVVGTITGWLSRRRMDELIPPPPEDPEHPEAESSSLPPYRQALHHLFRDKETRKKFADMGAEIIWVSVGHLRPDPNVDPAVHPDADATGHDKIYSQILDTWSSKHEALVKDEIASAQGYAKWLEDTSRAQVLAGLISNVTNGLNEAREAGLPMVDVITARVTEYLASASERGGRGGLDRLSSLLQYSDEKLLESPKKEKDKDDLPPLSRSGTAPLG